MQRAHKLIGTASAFLFLALTSLAPAAADEFTQDFRKSQYDSRVLVVTKLDAATFVKPEAQGLRIALPKGARVSGRVGFNLLAQVAGDFEVTAAIEIVDLPGAGSAGLMVALNNNFVEGETLSISRGTKDGSGQFWVAAHNRNPEMNFQSSTTTATTASKTNQVRITRKGTTVQFAVAEGNSTDFQQLLEVTDCGATYSLQISVDPRDCPDGIDSRVQQLKVSGAVNVQAFLQQQRRGAAFGGKFGNLGLMWWGLGAVGVVGVGAAAFRWVKLRGDDSPRVRRARPTFRSPPIPAPASPAPASSDSPPSKETTPEPSSTRDTPEQPDDRPAIADTKPKNASSPEIAKQPPAAPVAPEVDPSPPPTTKAAETKDADRVDRTSPAPTKTRKEKKTKSSSRESNRADLSARPAAADAGASKASPPPAAPVNTPERVDPPKVQTTPPLVHTMNPNTDASGWDEAALQSLESKARDFLKVNPGAVSYGERHKFRFHFQDGKIHGSFVAWWETDVEAIKAMGLIGKAIEDRLTKKFEGLYDFGQRQGRFTHWNKQGHATAVDYDHGVGGSPYSPAQVSPPETSTPHQADRSETQPAVAAEPVTSDVSSFPTHWDEPCLAALEQKALDFLKVNPDAVSYGERHHFRFRFEAGKLDGPFAVWWKMDVEAIKAMGVRGRELEDRLAKRFAGQYKAGRRHGTITYWDERAQAGQMDYADGRGVPIADAVPKSAPPPAEPVEPAKAPELTWDEAAFREIEQRALDFLEDNPQVQTYVERTRFRFQVADGRLHGPFVVWKAVDPQTLESLGANKKEIEEKLPKRFEGEYRVGARHGAFTHWDDSGRSCVMEFGEHGQAVPPQRASTAVWDETLLCALEKRADEFIEDNPDAAAFVERYQFRFTFQQGKLHGPFIVWRKVDEATIKSLGSDRKEIEENLPKRFVGLYEQGRRHGAFTYWNDSDVVVEVNYVRGVVQT
jgi:hypothetical protein